MATDPNADLGNPVIIQPGDSATITPTGREGTRVNGGCRLTCAREQGPFNAH